MSSMTQTELARQATRSCKAPNSITVEAIEKLTEVHVARCVCQRWLDDGF